MPWLLLLIGCAAVWLAYNVHRPAFAPERRAMLSFLAGWIAAELAPQVIALEAIATALCAWGGGLAHWPGRLGLVLVAGSWVALLRAWRRGFEAEATVEQALRDALGADYRAAIEPALVARFGSGIDWRRALVPLPMRHPEVERVRDIPFARVAGLTLKLDVYRPRHRPPRCPTLLQIHGGGWMVGSKNEQAIPLMLHLAARGWVCVTANYRLSPHATFPDHLVDCKRALRWIREHGEEFGADPGFVAVTGGSAGGHLAALMALTANDPEYQPGFEGVDTTVAACVAFYGVYDFTDRHGYWHHDGLHRMLERQIMKAARDEAPDAYTRASPMSRVHADAPPFFVIHGDLDTLVPVEEARHFVGLLRSATRNPVVYAEIPGAQHAFEMFPSPRTQLVVQGVERFLAYVYSRHLAARRDDTPAAAVG